MAVRIEWATAISRQNLDRRPDPQGQPWFLTWCLPSLIMHYMNTASDFLLNGIQHANCKYVFLVVIYCKGDVSNSPCTAPNGTLNYTVVRRGELSYLAPLGSEDFSAPYFKQCFFQGGRVLPPRQSNTTPPSPKTEITNILFYILNFPSIITFKM